MMVTIDKLCAFIKSQDGIGNKKHLIEAVKLEFALTKDRSVYYNDDFAIRFCMAKSSKFSNTVLSLPSLLKYDSKPFIVCVVTKGQNYLLLANTTFLKKISHSSKAFRKDNIRGSFNGSDIDRFLGTLENVPENFDSLFAIHKSTDWLTNLERLVEATNNISPTGHKFEINATDKANILDSVDRAIDFAKSADYQDLFEDLKNRVNRYENEIFVASLIENVNIRGRIIEYLIAGNNDDTRKALVQYLQNNASMPEVMTKDSLGDFMKEYPNFYTETDIKTKVMVLMSAPKGYNLDKLLEFLSLPKSVFMMFFVGVDYENKKLTMKLISIYQKTLLKNILIQTHWAGRNSRGVSQFNGAAIKEIILKEKNDIDKDGAIDFLNRIMNL